MKVQAKHWLAVIPLALVALLGTIGDRSAKAYASESGGNAPRVTELVVFGASSADQGNALLLVGAATPPYYDGRFSNGPNWIDILADELGLQRPSASLEGGKNYSVAGAETGPGYGTLAPFAPNLGEQINLFFLDSHELKGLELIIVQGGANDAFAQALLEPPEEVFWTPERAVANISDHIRTLAGAGGTRFLVPNLGGFANNLFLRPFGLNADVTLWEAEFSGLLKNAVAGLQDELHVNIFFFDADKMAQKILEQPARLGLTNLSDPACPGCGRGRPAPGAGDTVVPNPDEYYYWDLLHTTRVVQEVVGQKAAALIRGEVPVP